MAAQLPQSYKCISLDMMELTDLKARSDAMTIVVDNLQKERKVSEFFEAFQETQIIRTELEQKIYLTRLSEDLIFENFFHLLSEKVALRGILESPQDREALKRLRVRAAIAPQETAALMPQDQSFLL